MKIRYAEQVVTPEVNKSVVECIGELKRFQDRLYFKDPIKAKMRRRLVFGLREVHKSVTLQRAKAVVVAPNIEETEQEGAWMTSSAKSSRRQRRTALRSSSRSPEVGSDRLSASA